MKKIRETQKRKKLKKKLIPIIVAVAVLLALSVVGVVYVWNRSLHMQYPKKFEDAVERCAEDYNLDAHLIYAIIRTESGFDSNAVSRAGAVGLMQLMPATAMVEAGKIDMDDYSEDKLRDPEVNIRLGCHYFMRVLDDFDGDVKCAVAAYNGGPNKVGEWLRTPLYSADGVTLDYIPYRETRLYVEKVLSAYEMYNKIYPNS